MLRIVALCALAALVTAQQQQQQGSRDTTNGAGPYVFDLMATPLNAAEVTALFETAVPGETFPIYNEPPKTNFNCQGKLGYYADPAAGCQAFQRCTLNGDQVAYLCPNGTLFNQLVLVCDWWFNVDCSKAESWYNFANPRIYSGPGSFLHDTPPSTYIAPWQRKQLETFNAMIAEQQRQFARINERLTMGGQGGQGQQSQQSNQANFAASASQQQPNVEAQQPQGQQQQQQQNDDSQSSQGASSSPAVRASSVQHSSQQKSGSSSQQQRKSGSSSTRTQSSNSGTFRGSSSSNSNSNGNQQQAA